MKNKANWKFHWPRGWPSIQQSDSVEYVASSQKQRVPNSLEKHLHVAKQMHISWCLGWLSGIARTKKDLARLQRWPASGHVSQPPGVSVTIRYPMDGSVGVTVCRRATLRPLQTTWFTYSLTNPRQLAANPCLSTEACRSWPNRRQRTPGSLLSDIMESASRTTCTLTGWYLNHL